MITLISLTVLPEKLKVKAKDIYLQVNIIIIIIIIIGPILDRLKEKILKPWKGALSSHFRVCL